MPNAWDQGSAIMLAQAGFQTIGTTSAGIAFSAGLPDHQRINKKQMLKSIKDISDAVDIPVNADLEAGYSRAPEEIADIVVDIMNCGAVGANIEDFTGDHQAPLFEFNLAVDRIRAAAEATTDEFTLNARCDAYLTGHPNALSESIRRCNAYFDVGADCVFVPGVTDKETITTLVSEISGPLNVVMGLSGSPLTVADLNQCGVKRISVGGSIVRAVFGLIRRAGEEMMHSGTFTFANEQFEHTALCDLFDGWHHRHNNKENNPL